MYTYLKYKCVQKMSSEDINRFKKIVQQYAGRLNETDASNGKIYTLHDFNHHCRNLYRIISEDILADNAYGDDGLTDRELYILNIAVLLHDIGLKDKVYIDRERHAKLSAKIIEDEYARNYSAISEAESNLSQNDIYALSAIVEAHSDDKSEMIIKCALDNKELTNDMVGSFGQIRAHFLANILRMADELDITTERLGGFNIIQELEEAKKQLIKEEVNEGEKIQNYKNAVGSLEHWKRLLYFSEIYSDESGTVHAVMDKHYIGRVIEGGGSLDEIISQTKKIRKKILKEFRLFTRDVSQTVANNNLIRMKRFVIDVENQDIKNELERESISDDISHDVKINIISEEYEKKISDFIKKRQLWDGGHFYRKDDLCARDWINIREITGTNDFFKKFESIFISSIDSLIDLAHVNKENVAIIGVDFSGMLIGSKAGLTLGIPFIYAKNEDKSIPNSPRKLTVELGDNISHVIIMTDVIVTYHTIDALLEKYQLKDKLLAIFGILYREPIVSGEYEKDLIKGDFTELEKKTYVFNKDYGIELHCSKDCPIKNDYRCIADNLPAGL